MNMKKIKIAILLALALCVAGCKKAAPRGGDITGEWKLQSYYGNAAASSQVSAMVYLNFKADGTLELFQCLGDAGHFTAFTGTYETADGLLTGKYDGNTSSSWGGSYIYYAAADVLTLENSVLSGSGTCVYERCAIPEEVRKDASDYGAD